MYFYSFLRLKPKEKQPLDEIASIVAGLILRALAVHSKPTLGAVLSTD